MGPLPAPKPAAHTKEALKLKSRIDTLITKMQKDEKFAPTREQLEDIAEDMIDFISKNHFQITPHDSYLKAAVVNLTEVPVMAPQMQRISFLIALRDTSREMDLFLSCF
jgi:regulator of sigma D